MSRDMSNDPKAGPGALKRVSLTNGLVREPITFPSTFSFRRHRFATCRTERFVGAVQVLRAKAAATRASQAPQGTETRMNLTIELPDRDTVEELAKLAKKNRTAHADYAKNPLISRRKASTARHTRESERWGRLEAACAKALASETKESETDDAPDLTTGGV